MNILILTPDSVGSTFLQRMITIYMQFHEFDKPVINLHELTNGIEKYYSPEFGQEILSKRRLKNWGYHQSLKDIVETLSTVDHYKTARLAQYHVMARKDSIEDQVPFYRYLDDNFFIISSRRKNVFEHALSIALSRITKKLNVFSHSEKINTFGDMYANKIYLDPESMVHQLERYKSYLSWSSDYFNIGSFFYYDEHVVNIEKYILNLPIFTGNKKLITWKEKFDIEFNDWNRCHHIPSDIGYIAQENRQAFTHYLDNSKNNNLMLDQTINQQLLLQSNQTQSQSQDLVIQNLTKYFPKSVIDFYKKNLTAYQTAMSALERMQELDIIMNTPPIKKQTLSEKMFMIKNIDQCLDVYNEWITKNPTVGNPWSREDLDHQIKQESEFWHGAITKELAEKPNFEQLKYQNDVGPWPNPNDQIE